VVLSPHRAEQSLIVAIDFLSRPKNKFGQKAIANPYPHPPALNQHKNPTSRANNSTSESSTTQNSPITPLAPLKLDDDALIATQRIFIHPAITF